MSQTSFSDDDSPASHPPPSEQPLGRCCSPAADALSDRTGGARLGCRTWVTAPSRSAASIVIAAPGNDAYSPTCESAAEGQTLLIKPVSIVSVAIDEQVFQGGWYGQASTLGLHAVMEGFSEGIICTVLHEMGRRMPDLHERLLSCGGCHHAQERRNNLRTPLC
jgi:hypothetical protein